MIFAWLVTNTDLINMSNAEALMEFPNEDMKQIHAEVDQQLSMDRTFQKFKGKKSTPFHLSIKEFENVL